MIISHSKKFIFVHISKCGGMTITNELTKILGKGDLIISGPNPIIVGKPISTLALRSMRHSPLLSRFFRRDYLFSLKKHSTALDICNVLGKSMWEQYYKFCVARNPYDRLVSAFFWIKKNRGIGLKNKKLKLIAQKVSQVTSFSDFIKSDEFFELARENFLIPISVQIFDETGYCMVDDIVKLESLSSSIQKISLFEDSRVFDKARKNISNRERDYRIYYDREARNIVTQIYKSDIDLLGYEF
jgi:hypothetical protein